MLLVGVLDKVGTYGMIRFCLQLFPEAAQWATPVVITLAVISIIYGALLAIGQTDMMRLIAFTSISHFGFIVLGIFALTTRRRRRLDALHGQPRVLDRRRCSCSPGSSSPAAARKRIPDYGGWQRVTPVLAGTFLVVGLSGLALPGLSSFVSEFLVLQGTFMRYEAAAVIATLGIVLAALYILLMYQRMMTGPKPSFAEGEAPRDLSLREKVVVVPIIASFILLGFFPKPVLDLLNPAVDRTLVYVGVTDPSADHRLRERQVTAAVTAATEFQAVDVDYAAIAPMLIVVAGALVGVLVEAFAPRRSRHGIQVWLTTLVLVGAFAALLVWSRDSMTVTLGGSVVIDGVSVFLRAPCCCSP